jgi:hypothetical protein
MDERTHKIVDYITKRYGSMHAFKLLKYFLEHKLARERKGLAVYEVAFKIAPSEVLTKYALEKIECQADDAEQKDAEKALDSLIKKGVMRSDPETDILELVVPVDSVANVYLKEKGKDFEVVQDASSADVLLLTTTIAEIPTNKVNHEYTKFAGVPDVLLKDKSGKFTLVEIKIGAFINRRKPYLRDDRDV